jgi:DNA-binding Lrp family transcriptional regulator
MELSSVEKKILYNIQNELPLSSHPFKIIADNIMDEQEVIQLIKNFKERGIIRRISALFNSKRLGYVTTLIAMKVPEKEIDTIATIVDEYDEITHNYERDDEYNMWFTLITPSQAVCKRLINMIKQKTGIEHLLNLPPIRRFKINTIFRIPDMDFNQQNLPHVMYYEEDMKDQTAVINIDDLDKKIFKYLQDIPVISNPYQLISDKLYISQEELLQKINSYKKSGIIRNIRAVLDHYKIGLNENVMVVFKVAQEDIPNVVDVMVSYPQITHCYERATCNRWQYNLFIVIHEKTKEECEHIISEILSKTGIKEYKKLYTKRELKKTNPRYF